MTMPHARHDPFPCPWCGSEMDATTNPRVGAPGHVPKDGDFSLCIDCQQPAVFVVSPLGLVSLRKPDAVEAAEFEVDHGHVRAGLESVRNSDEPDSAQ